MKKTVIFDFPDDFQFPKYFGEKNTVLVQETRLETTGELFSKREIPDTTCRECPFCTVDEICSSCIITKDDDYDENIQNRKQCPFYSGSETINYNEY